MFAVTADILHTAPSAVFAVGVVVVTVTVPPLSSELFLFGIVKRVEESHVATCVPLMSLAARRKVPPDPPALVTPVKVNVVALVTTTMEVTFTVETFPAIVTRSPVVNP